MTKKIIKSSDVLGDNYYIYELTSSNYTPALNGSITITCIMKDVYGTVANGKSITLYQNGTSKGAQTTNSSGVATWPITCSNAGIQSFKVGNKAIEVFVDNKEDTSNKVSSWSSTTTDTHYPSEKLVKDSLDGKQEELVSGTNLKTLNGVDLLGEGDIAIGVGFGGGSTIIYQPTLDGTESITTIATYTPTITDNTLTNGCGYLTNGWDNTIDWELTFDYYTTGDNNGYLVIPKGTTQRDYNGLQQWYCNQLNFYVNGTKPTGYITDATSCNEWISVKITKIGYIWTVYYNGVQKTQWDTESYASTVDSWTEMCIGLDKNSSSRYSTIKNIKVKTIGGSSGNTIHLGDDIMTMIDTALGHMISNWEDYE